MTVVSMANETGFYVTGGTLSAAALSYVERWADSELLSPCVAASSVMSSMRARWANPP